MTSAGKWLVVTEKPSVAADIAKALGGFEKKADHYEGEKYCLTWAVGHLLELLSPEDIDVKYKRWLLQDLPILPEKFEYKPKEGQKDRLDHIRALAKRKDTLGLINACDAGREGELIFREVFDFCGTAKETKRIWLQSMTKDSILQGFKNIRSGKEFEPLGDAARCRAESDWLIGMNGTRAITRRLRPKAQKGASWSVGRVQTPTLALLVRREMEILKHRPETYWSIEGRFSAETHEYSGQWFDPTFKKPVQNEEDSSVREKDDRIFSKAALEKVLADIQQHKGTAVASEVRKESKEIAPQLFDLTTLQREANRRFGMPASRTLQAAQRLYEKHKVLTYPRTDSKYLPEDYVDQSKKVIETFAREASGGIAAASSRIVKKGMLNKERIFNNKFISDHFAIIPTGEVNLGLEGDDQRIFDLVLKRFLAAFMPPAVWAKVERISKVGAQSFRTRVQDLQEPGWREVYGLDSEEESKLPKLNEKNPTSETRVEALGVDSTQSSTKPAPRVSEAKLLSLMEHCGRTVEDENLAEALGEKGIGTPATRADIIENLIVKEYVQRSGKALKATAKGIRLVDVMSRIPILGLASVELTGEMEHDLKLVEKGQKKREDFMNRMRSFTAEVVEKAKGFEYDAIYAGEPSLGECPSCKKGKVFESFWAYKCNNKEDGCEYIIWKEKNLRYIDRSLVTDVLKAKTFGPIEFLSNSGAPYEALVTANEKGFFLLDESGKPIESMSLANAEVLREESVPMTALGYPGKIVETEIAYLCEFLVGEAASAQNGSLQAGAEGTDGALEAEGAAGKKGAKKAAAKTKTPKVAKPKTTKPAKKLTSRMPRILCGHPISFEDYKRFILTGVTPAITEFKSKKGRPFAASLHLKANGNFEFKFESRKKLVEGTEGAEAKPKVAKPKKTAAKAKVVKKSSKVSAANDAET